MKGDQRACFESFLSVDGARSVRYHPPTVPHTPNPLNMLLNSILQLTLLAVAGLVAADGELSSDPTAYDGQSLY
jgi:hypothetical protein